MFNLTVEELEKRNAVYTAKEIYQQSEVWQELMSSLSQQESLLKEFIDSIYKNHEKVNVIFTGAGTSAFAGDTLVPELNKHRSHNHVEFEAVPTTDIVTNPKNHLFKDVPTVLVSFARSGNSPESVAAVKLGQKIVQDFYQVVVTCNKDGQLAKDTKNDEDSITILMPEKAHDQSFAMTSSFTSMVLAAYTMFTGNTVADDDVNQIVSNAKYLVDSVADRVDKILTFDFERIVFLGSDLLGQLSHEAALKMLELTAGKVAAIHESSLGFRHGPKSFLNEKSLVVLFISQDAYTRKYDMDILRELTGDDSGMKVVAVTERKDEEVEQLADWTVPVNFGKEDFSSDFYLSFLYVIVAQTLALKKSLQLGITPDNPSPDGKVNRVVKGVTIYDFVE